MPRAALATNAWTGHLRAMGSLAETVRTADPDRYFCALFAPARPRHALFTLYAFNHELARALEVASVPGLALIRLQWWREVVEGDARRHELATPLRALLDAGELKVAPLLAMIAAREDLAEGAPATLDALLAAPAALADAAGALLGASDRDRTALRAIGAAYGLAGTLRNVPALARRGRCLLPDDFLTVTGLTREQAIEDPAAAVAACGPAMRAAGLALLGTRRRFPRAVIAAALPGVLARRDLRRPGIVAARGLGDRLAVLRAAARCVV
jgi:phytoene synthase